MNCKTIIRLRGGILFFFLNALAVALLSPCSLLSAAPNPNGQPNADFSQARLSTLYQTMIRLGEAGDFEAAIPIARQALSLSESLFGPRHATTGNFAFNVGEMYRSAGHYYEAVPFFKRALEIHEETPGLLDPVTATNALKLADVYMSIDRGDEALPLYRLLLSIREKSKGSEDIETAQSMDNLAKLLWSMGQYGEALPLYRHALAIREKADPAGTRTAATLNNLAILYISMGLYEEAMPLSARALSIQEQALGPAHPGTARVLNTVAALYIAIGHYEDALKYAKRALSIDEALDRNHPDTTASLNNVAEIYQSMGRYHDALPMYSRALENNEMTLGEGNRQTLSSQNNLAFLYTLIGKDAEALPLYQRALSGVLARDRGSPDPVILAAVAANLCGLSTRFQPPRVEEAIFYCKMSVNASQRMRAGAKGLEPSLRETFARTLDGPYKRLADLLVERGRLVEAEQVLLALKDAEYLEFVRGGDASGSPVSLTPTEQLLAKEMNDLADELGKIYAELDANRRRVSVLAPEMLTQREERRDLLQQQLIAKLGAVSGRLKSPIAQARLDTPQLTAMTLRIRELDESTYGEQAVILMYVPEERVTTVLVTSIEGVTAVQLPVGFATLKPLIDNFWQRIQLKEAYRPQAEALYEHLIAPVEAHLRIRKLEPKTVMLYLTDRLRYLPFAALVDRDGKHLVEKYHLTVFTAATRDNIATNPVLHWSVTAFGSTTAHGNLTALPSVSDEIKGIVREGNNLTGLLPGHALLDNDFNRAAWQKVINGQSIVAGESPSSVVHVATHFKSDSDWTHSYLLLGDGGDFKISDLKGAISNHLASLDLITLSACATELTDQTNGQEAEGLGATFQKMGARAVIGTLWPIQDEGSAALMRAFYAARGEQRKMSKAAALQAAQLALLEGHIKASNPKVDFTQPYYWAPFILMGNWL